jgi:hypothetical protein
MACVGSTAGERGARSARGWSERRSNERCCRRGGVADGVVGAVIGRGVVNRRVRRDVNARRVNVSTSDDNV